MARTLPNLETPASPAARSADESGVYFAVNAKLLGREGEIELSTRMETAYRSIYECILRSEGAKKELARIARDLRAQTVSPLEVAINLDEESLDASMDLVRLLEKVSVLESFKPKTALSRKALAYVRELEKYRLERRILGRLQEAVKEANVRSALDLWLADLDATKQAFVEANIRLVFSISGRHTKKGVDTSDLIQEGMIGLLRAIDKYDHARGFRFSTYATWWIRQAMTRAIADQSRTIRLPVHLGETRQAVLRAQSNYQLQFGTKPTDAELAEIVGIPVEKVQTVLQAERKTISMELPVAADHDAQISDFIADEKAVGGDTFTEIRELIEKTKTFLRVLSEREQTIVRLRFGLDGKEERTLDEVGVVFDLTRERIRQIEMEALKKLRSVYERERMHEFVDR